MSDKKPGEKLFGEYMEELGICTDEQVQQALAYCQACSHRSTYLSIGQALVELGFTSQDKIDEVLQIQAKDRAAAAEGSSEGAEAPASAEAPDTSVAEVEAEEEEVEVEAVAELDVFTPEQAEQLGLFTGKQVHEGVQHCLACIKVQRYLSLGQALVELGFATRADIVQGLETQSEQDASGAEDIHRLDDPSVDAARLALLARQASELGLCTSEESDDVIGYWQDCIKRHRQISLAQALVELGYTTKAKIDETIASHGK